MAAESHSISGRLASNCPHGTGAGKWRNLLFALGLASVCANASASLPSDEELRLAGECTGLEQGLAADPALSQDLLVRNRLPDPARNVSQEAGRRALS